MPKRLGVRKSAASANNSQSSGSQNSQPWQTQTGFEQIKLYNPNDFSNQQPVQPAAIQQSWDSQQNDAWSHVHDDAPQLQPENYRWDQSNGEQTNGQSDPWNWGVPSTPSPSNLVSQPPQFVSNNNMHGVVPLSNAGVSNYSDVPVDSGVNYTVAGGPHEYVGRENVATVPTDHSQNYGVYQQQWDGQGHIPQYDQSSWDNSQWSMATNNQWQHPDGNQNIMPTIAPTEARDFVDSNVISDSFTSQDVHTQINPQQAGVEVAAIRSDIQPVQDNSVQEEYLSEVDLTTPTVSEAASLGRQNDTSSFDEVAVRQDNDSTNSLQPDVLPMRMTGQAAHLFQRSDSWLSGSSLQTIHNSLSDSQDMLDASHFMPQDTIDAIRQHMASMAIGDSNPTDPEESSNNQEVPAVSSADLEVNVPPENAEIKDPVQTLDEQQRPLESSPQQNEESEDGVRQPPDGAAAVRPLNIAAGSAVRQPSDSPPTVPVVTLSDQNSNEDEGNSSSPQQREENVENIESVEGAEDESAVVETLSVHSSNRYSGIIGPREGSPFKPVVAQVIQHETPDVQTSSSASRAEDRGANLEIMPDNVEQPIDIDQPANGKSKENKKDEDTAGLSKEHLVKANRGEYNSSPSATLWQNPEPQKTNVILAPATSDPQVQQKVLIVPQLGDQQEVLDNPLGKAPSPTLAQMENHELPNPANRPSSTNFPAAATNVSGPPTGPPKPVENLDAATKKPSSILGDAKPLKLFPQMQPEVSRPQGSAFDVPLPKIPITNNQDSALVGGGDTEDPGQRPPVPGFGITQSPPGRASSEPPEEPLPPRAPVGKDRARGGRDDHWQDSGYDHRDNGKNDDIDRPVLDERGRDSSRERFERRQHDRDYRGREPYDDPYRDDPRYRDRDHYSDHREDNRDGSRRGYPADPRQPDAYDRHESGRDRYDRRDRYDDRYYSHDRDRSRPSSRSSVEYEQNRGHRGSNRDSDRRYPPERPLSRGGYDSDRESGSYRRSGDYYRDDYRRQQPYYNGPDYRRYEDPYYDRYQNDYRYNNYNYGYYAELYRSDPRYRMQYEEYMRNYYGQTRPYETSDRRSVQSGRSSVNDDLRKEGEKYSQQASPASVQYTGSQSFEQPALYPDYSQNESNYYYPETYASEVPETPVVRLTPAKFQTPHVKVQFTATGLLVKVLPNNPADGQPAVVEISEIQSLFTDTEEIETFKSFPGPLLKTHTHKNDVIQFCANKAKEARDDINLNDRESCVLIWDLLNLMVRQNGTVVGTDIAELLLKDCSFSENPEQSQNTEASLSDGASSVEATTPDEGVAISKDRSVITRLTEDAVTRKFREYLLFGRKKEALEKAMKNGLWGHALFLASKMDNRTHATVMTRFANSLALNDPLQTLYQLMSGRQPAAVTCVAEEKWGDWRPHLAMILSNTTQRPEVDRRSIATLGDTLATRGCFHASQFCYLVAELEFGTYSSKSSKLVLLLGNHSLPFNQFATNEAIQCTEIYEYAQSLANAQFMLPHFQSYRFIYATRLAEVGFSQEALHYCEITSSFVCKMPAAFQPEMVKQVYELANKLKYSDPFYANSEGERSELGDPEWLMQLNNVLQAYSNGMITPMAEGFNAYQYYQNQEMNSSEQAEQPNAQQVDTSDQQVYENTTAPQAEVNAPVDNTYGNYAYAPVTPSNAVGSSEMDMYSTPPEPQLQQQPYFGGNYGDYSDTAHQSQPQGVPQANESYYYSSDTSGMGNVVSDDHHNANMEHATHTEDGNSYWDEFSKQGSPPPSPIKPVPQLNDDRRRSSSGNSKASEKQEGKHDHRQQKQGGWFGGIISKFMPKPKNQMILPDDKNPTIVWDSSQNKWVNNDADEDPATSGPAAPPKDSDIMGPKPVQQQQQQLLQQQQQQHYLQQQQQQQQQQQSMAPPMPSGKPEFNKFRRTGGIGARQSYVDVFAKNTATTSAAQLPPSMLPGMDINPTTSAPQFFIPTQAPDDSGGYTDYGSQNGSAQVGNPASRPSSSLSAAEGAAEVNQVSGAQHPTAAVPPMMFNPSQMVPQTSATSISRGGRLNPYGRRYPR